VIRGTRLEDAVDWLGVRLAEHHPTAAEWLWRLTGLWSERKS
jgi:hypothetical protein